MVDSLMVAAARLPERPLRWWSVSALEVLQRELNRVWQAWATRWELDLPHLVVFNASEVKDAPDLWQLGMLSQPSAVHGFWVGSNDGESPAVALAELMFISAQCEAMGSRRGSLMALGVAEKAWAQCEDELLRLLGASEIHTGVAPPSLQSPKAEPWTGDVRVLARCGGFDLWLHLSADRVAPLLSGLRRKWSGRMPALDSSVPAAIADRPFSMRVELNPTELDLGALQSLRVGDVLTLSHSLDQPLTLKAQLTGSVNGGGVCRGYLGARNGKRAIELMQNPLA